MADKSTKLSIIIATVDKATAGIRAVNARLDALTKPTRDFGKALGELSEKSGLHGVIDGFKGVGSAIGDLLGKVAMIGGVAGVAVAGLIHLVDGFEDLGKKAERLGVSVDFLAEMRDAAERTGVPVEALDESLLAFNANLGQASAGTGRMAKFLGLVSPALLLQVKAAKDNAAAFDLIAGAMAKVTDPAKRAALAQKAFGDSALAPLFAKGPKALQEMREHYLKLAGSQEAAVKAATETADALHDLHAATDGVKASLVSGLAPALKVIIGQLTEWLSGHQADIKQWAADIGKKLPGAVHAVVDAVKGAVDWVVSFVDKIGGLKTVAIAAAAILVGPLIAALASLGAAFVSLGVTVLASPIGLQIAAWTAAAVAFVAALDGAVKAGRWLKEKAEYQKSVNDFSYEIKEGSPDLSDDEVMALARKSAAQAIGQSRAREALDDRMAQEQIEGASHPAAPAAPVDPENYRSLVEAARNALTVLTSRETSSSSTKVNVHFTNAPKGTRITTDPQSTGDVDLSTGLQMSFAP